MISASKKGYSTEQIVVKKGELKNDIVIQLSRPSDCITLIGVVKNNVNGGPISYALVSFSNEKGDIKSIPTDQLGAFSICVPCGHEYRAYATKEGKMSTVEAITTKELACSASVPPSLTMIELKIAAPVSKDFTMNEGNSFQLRNIYYNFNAAPIVLPNIWSIAALTPNALSPKATANLCFAIAARTVCHAWKVSIN